MKKCLTLLLLFSLLTGCGTHMIRQSKTVYAMDTVMTLTAYGDDSVQRGMYTLPEYALVNAEEQILRLEDRLSVSRTDSDIFQLNQNGYLTFASHLNDTTPLLETALEIADMTDGDFDPTVYPLMELWGFPSKEYRVPDQAELDALLSHVDYTQVKIQSGEISLPQGCKLDLGGIAKGYTSEQALAVMEESGVESAIVSLGGNVGALGLKPDGTPWTVAIQDPSGDSGYIATLSLGEAGGKIYAITSGGYERYFTQNGKVYHHILDPKTGAPADTDLLSVTIVSPSGTLADALSTALFVKGFQDAVAFWQKYHDQFEMVLVTGDGLFATDGLSITSEQPVQTLEVSP